MEENPDRWIWINPNRKKKILALRFRIKGYSKQFFLSTGLIDNARNRSLVRLRRDAIELDIILGNFDDSLEKYKFNFNQSPPAKKIEKPQEITLLEIWDKFSQFQETQIEKTTILNKYRQVKNSIVKLPTQSVNSAVAIRDFVIKNLPKISANITLNYYHQACEWAVINGFLKENPFEGLKTKKPRNASKIKAFTVEQRDIIISAFESNSKYSHYANLVKFLFLTGCRSGEAFALTWNDISLDCRKISIDKSCNFKRIKKSTKNGKSRVFPVAENSKLHKLLLSMGRKDGLVFRSIEGLPITSHLFYPIWKGYPGSPGLVWQLFQDGKLPLYLRPYAARHTFATWAIASGATPDRVARWMGDSLKTILDYYCHPEIVDGDCPDF
jgi:integrase